VKTVGAARDAVLRIDAAIDQVSANRSSFGATDARLEAIVSQARQDSAILQTAHGRIVDADMAGESAALARNQVLQQAGIAMVAQANVRSQDVLTLLR
jgi:flagellin